MPSLTFEALKKQIEARNLAPVYLFVGQDVQLVARMVDAIEATVDEADRPFAVERMHAGEEGASPVDIIGAARTMPMLGDRRIVFVMRSERLLKPKRAGKAAEDDEDVPADEPDGPIDTAPLEEYAASPVASTTLVFVAAEVDKTRRLTKKLMEKASCVSFDGNERDDPRGDIHSNLANVMRVTLERDGRSIDKDAGAQLLQRAAGDVSKLRDDLERLVLFAGERTRITLADVEDVSAVKTKVDDVWAVVNAIGAGDAATALRETAKRFDNGDSPHALVGQLRWWVSSKLSGADPRRVRSAVDAVLRTDLALKSSRIDGRVLVERLVVELTGSGGNTRSGPRGARY